MMKASESKLLERSFEPCYQATVGMDFVSKLVTLEVREKPAGCHVGSGTQTVIAGWAADSTATMGHGRSREISLASA